MPITEPSLPLTALLGLSFESGDLSVLPLGKLFRKVLYSNTRIPSAASYLGNCFIFFLNRYSSFLLERRFDLPSAGVAGWAFELILEF